MHMVVCLFVRMCSKGGSLLFRSIGLCQVWHITVNQLNFAARKFCGLIIIANLGIFRAI